MEFDDLTEYEDIDPHIGRVGKISRRQSKDEDTHDVKRTRLGCKRKIQNPRLQRRLGELGKIRRIRAESRSVKKEIKSAKRRRGSDDGGEAYLSDSDDEGDILTQPTEQGKKNVDISSGNDSDGYSEDSSVIFVDESNRHPSEKRKAVPSYHQNKYIRQMPTSLQRKYKTLKFPGTKNIPEPIASSLSILRPRRQSATPASSIPSLPAIDNPFLSAEEIIQRTLYPLESYNLLIEPRTMRKKKQVNEKKKGGKIELDFIPYNEAIAYEFYDDPNELCDRLRLLIAPRAAGNSNHGQEINSIVSELRELGIVL